MPKPKIDRVKLSQFLNAGRSQKEVAEVFGVSEGAISKAKKELIEKRGVEVGFPRAVVSPPSVEAIKPIVTEHLNLIAQLRHINDSANEILGYLNRLKAGEGISEAEHRKLNTAIKASAEIRLQCNYQTQIFEKLNGAQAAMEFNRVVLEEIEQARCPACGATLQVQAAIITRLRDWRARQRAGKV